MSLGTPKIAQPQYIYSNKVLFFTELDIDGKPIADKYILYVRKVQPIDESSSSSSSSSVALSEELWDFIIEIPANRTLGTVPKVVVVEGLDAATLYEAIWELRETANSGSYWSELNTFRTRYRERFKLRPAIPAPLHGADFTYALQAELDEHINYINTLEEERSLDNLVKEGIGKIEGGAATINMPLSGRPEATLAIVPEGLVFVNGFFQTSCSLDPTNAAYFLGARLFQSNNSRGYSYLGADNLPKIDAEKFQDLGGTGSTLILYGYLSAYINDEDKVILDFYWDEELLNPRPIGRWLVGKVTFTVEVDEISGEPILTPTFVDNSMADIIWSHKIIREHILALEGLIQDINEGNWPRSAKELVFDPDTDPNESTYEAVLRIRAELRQLVEDQLGGGAILAEQESLIENIANNFARAMVGLGKLVPNALTRVDGAWILEGKYGDGKSLITMDNGNIVISPNFEGDGNLNNTEDGWEV